MLPRFYAPAALHAGGIIELPDDEAQHLTRVLRLKDGTNAQVFVDYYVTKNLTLKLSVNNVLDEFFAVGYQSANVVDPIFPRTVSLFVKYHF